MALGSVGCRAAAMGSIICLATAAVASPCLATETTPVDMDRGPTAESPPVDLCIGPCISSTAGAGETGMGLAARSAGMQRVVLPAGIGRPAGMGLDALPPGMGLSVLLAKPGL